MFLNINETCKSIKINHANAFVFLNFNEICKSIKVHYINIFVFVYYNCDVCYLFPETLVYVYDCMTNVFFILHDCMHPVVSGL